MLYVIITNILAVVLVLGVMILIHEAGHFVAAKYFGIRVHVFSFGFGPRLIGFERGGTDYRISALPLGGYVKMAGENAGDEVSGAPDEFQSKPRWQRFIVGIMGPAMNILLAIGLLTALFMYRYQKPAYEEGPAIIGWIENDSPAAKAGLEPGDKITRIGDHANIQWGDVELLVASNPGQPLEVTVERNGQALTRSITAVAEGRSRIGSLGWYPSMPAKLQGVQSGLPAEKAGLKAGDEIVSIDGTPIQFGPRLSEVIQAKEGKDLEIRFLRNGQPMSTRLTPVLGSAEGDPQKKWRIGVACCKSDVITKQLSFPAALAESLDTNKRFAVLIFDLVGKIFEQKVSPRTLEGPIGIARLSGQAARQGLGDLISLMAAISLNLGVFNLFPIPVLDGGLLLLLMIEGLMRRDLSLRWKERVTQAGFVALMLLAVFVIYNDIVKSLPQRLERFFP
jgi:regulator of sigma E protease